jgi:hypothetical protein
VPYAPAADGDPPGEELEAYRTFGLLAGEAIRESVLNNPVEIGLYEIRA